MKITHEYDITDSTIQYVVNELNRLEYNGVLTLEKVKANTQLFEYLFSKEVIQDVLNGDISEAWRNDCFSDILDYL